MRLERFASLCEAARAPEAAAAAMARHFLRHFLLKSSPEDIGDVRAKETLLRFLRPQLEWAAKNDFCGCERRNLLNPGLCRRCRAYRAMAEFCGLVGEQL